MERTALHGACEANRLEVVQTLLEAGAKREARMKVKKLIMNMVAWHA